MPRIKEESTKLVTFRVSRHLAEQYADAVKKDERTLSAALRRHMRTVVEREQKAA